MCRRSFHPNKLRLPGTPVLWRNACVECLFFALHHCENALGHFLNGVTPRDTLARDGRRNPGHH